MNRYIILTLVVFLLLGSLSVTGNAELVFVDSAETVVCKDSLFWVDVRVDSMVDSIHSYACLMYIDTSTVYLDSVTRGTVFDSISQHHNVQFDWYYNYPYPDSLYFGASIFGAGTFVNGPGQLARIWLRTKREGVTPVAFGWCIIRDPYHPSGPGMDVTLEDGQIIVLGPGVSYGDVNDDGTINIGDVVYLVNYLYRNGQEPEPWWFVGTVNCDLVVNIGDVVYLVNYLYRGGEPPCDPCEE